MRCTREPRRKKQAAAPDYAALVAEWHQKFGVEMPTEPTVPPDEVRNLRLRLIAEEFDELIEASDDRNIVGVADALGDLLYVVFGTAQAWGIPIGEVFEEIQRSNMSKLMPDGTVLRREDSKIMKGPNYSPPNLGPIIKAALNGEAA